MKLLNPLRLLTRSSAPSQGVEAGAMYFDTTVGAPRFHDGTQWVDVNQLGFPDPATGVIVPDGRQVTYFDQFTNDGVLVINGTGTLIGLRP